MFFDCKVYDKNRKLIKVHTAEDLEKRSKEICLALLPDIDRKFIETFKGEDDASIQYEHQLNVDYETD